MDDEKYEKALKNAATVAIVVLVLVAIATVLYIVSGKASTVQIISCFIQIALLLATISGMKQKAIYGPLCGIIVAILMILALNLLDIIIGILYLIDNIRILKYMKDQ
ncbi:MAG: hypothetical protein IKP28_03220 [Clostridia bacterium]|nr:hypothetical protein [Clostridia bacterium]